MATTFMTDSQILAGLKDCTTDLNLFEEGLFKGSPKELCDRIDLFANKSYESPFFYAQNATQVKRLNAAKPRLKIAPEPQKIPEGSLEKETETLKKATGSSWTFSSLLSGLIPSSSKASRPASKSDKSDKPTSVDHHDSSSGVSSKSVVLARQSDRIPVGLHNENGNDCFTNAIRQFIYNTPMAEHVLSNLSTKLCSQDLRDRVLTDYENYQAQKAGKPMGGSKRVRYELMPASGQHDAQEAMMQLFNGVPIDYSNPKNPLFNSIENTRTFDLQSLPKGISYDNFTADAKDSFRVDGKSARFAVNTSRDVSGPLTLEIKPERGPTVKTMQEAWDTFANPAFEPTKPPYDKYETGAYLEKSTRLSKEVLESGRIFPNDKGTAVKVVPDKVGEHFRFHDLPEHLVFSLKRYSYSSLGGGKKINDHIAVDDTFRLDHRHVKTGRAADFRIEAFIVQDGSTGSGHYYTYVLKDGQWFKCNDSRVSQASPEEARAAMSRAYVFYAKRSGSVSQSSGMISPPRISPYKLSRESEKPARVPSYLVDKPTISVPLPKVGVNGDLLIGEANQGGVEGGSNSCCAQALGFLAKAINGKPVTASDIKPMLKENAQKFRALLTEQERAGSLSQAGAKTAGQQGVIDYVVEEVEQLAVDYKVFANHGSQKSDLESYKQYISKSILEKYRTFCPGSSLPALDGKLAGFVDQFIAGKLSKEDLSAEVKKVVLQDKAVDPERIESAKRLHASSYSGETRNFFDVYPKYQAEFGNRDDMLAETVTLDADIDMRIASVGSILSRLRETWISKDNNAVGAVMSVNGYTYSVALTAEKDGSVLYQVYDSHGKASLTGKDQAFVFQTKSESEAAQFLTKLAVYRPVEKGLERFKDPDQNILGVYTVLPAAPSTTSKVWGAVTHYTGSALYYGLYTPAYYGLYTPTYYGVKAISYPFVQIGGLLASACRRGEPIESATVGSSDVESTKAQLMQIKAKVERFKKSEEAFTEKDLSGIGDSLLKLQSAIKADPILEILESELSTEIAQLYGKLSEPSGSKKKVTSDRSSSYDPQGLIAFYQGGVKNKNGFTLEQILAFNDKQMEAHHDFIQWLFPTGNNGVNPQAPELNPELILAAKSDPKLKANMLRAFDKMLQYYGLERKSGDVVKASNFSNQRKNWVINGAHNLRRMTRIITSMGLLGYKAEAKAFGNCIIAIAKRGDVATGSIPQTYWSNAIKHHT